MAKAVLITEPESLAVSVAELKSFSRIDYTDDDNDLLPILLQSAQEQAERYLWTKLVSQTWDEYFDGFADPLVLRQQPVTSITSITYTDANQASQTLATSIYELGTVNGVSVARRKYNQDWPTTLTHEDVVTVRYVAGYAEIGTTGLYEVPDMVKHAIMIHADWAYKDRGAGILPFPRAFEQLLRPYSLRRWAALGA